MTPQVIGYARVSTAGQAEEGVYLAAQEERIRAWCLAHAYELRTVEVFVLVTGPVREHLASRVRTGRTPELHYEAPAGQLEMHPDDAEARGIRDGDLVGVASRAGEIVVHVSLTRRIARGVVYTTFHFPESGVNLVTTENSDWATNCPEYKS